MPNSRQQLRLPSSADKYAAKGRAKRSSYVKGRKAVAAMMEKPIESLTERRKRLGQATR